MSGKQRETTAQRENNGGELGPNSGKTGGKGAQTAGIWELLEKSVFGHKLPKNHPNFDVSPFFLQILGAIHGLFET